MVTKMVATIHRNEHGLWWVRCEGGGYPRELYLERPEMLLQLDAEGYSIKDPLHYIDTHGPAEWQEPECSVSAMDADSAGYGWHAVASERRDYGHTYYHEED